MKKKILGIGAICMSLAMAVSLTGCGKPADKNVKIDEAKKVVYTSFYPMYDFTKKIVGDKMDVVNLVPSGKEPHDYELTAEDRKNLEKATAIVYSGAGMEEWVDDLKKAMGEDKFIEASKDLKLLEGHHHHHHDHDHDHDKKDMKHEDHDHDHDKKDMKHEDHEHEHHLDPHVWLSPQNAKMQLKNIKDAIVKLDDKNKAYYEDNYKKYADEFDKLDKEYKEQLAPFAGKHIVVSHEAFGYMCKDYNLEQLGIEGISPESEPSPKKMAEIVEFVKKNEVKTIFFEELLSPKVSEAIAKETGAKTQMLNPLEGLSDEDMAAKKDYVQVMKENLKELVNSFK